MHSSRPCGRGDLHAKRSSVAPVHSKAKQITGVDASLGWLSLAVDGPVIGGRVADQHEDGGAITAISAYMARMGFFVKSPESFLFLYNHLRGFYARGVFGGIVPFRFPISAYET